MYMFSFTRYSQIPLQNGSTILILIVSIDVCLPLYVFPNISIVSFYLFYM